MARTLASLALSALLLAGCASSGSTRSSGDRAAPPRRPGSADAWSGYEVGAVIELRSHTIARPPMMPFEHRASIRHQVLALGPDEVTLLTRFQLTDPVGEPEDQESKVPRDAPPELDLDGTFVRSETITVPAGTFACSVYRAETTERGMKWVREVWTTPGIPMPVRFVQDGPSQTVVELARIEHPVVR